MAALLRYCGVSSLKIFVRPLSSSASGQIVASDVDAAESKTNIDYEMNDEESQLTEEQVQELCDISRMPKRYHDRMQHIMQPPEPLDYYNSLFQPQFVRRQNLAKYGRKSGIAAGIAWPSEEELKEIIEFEREWEPSLQSMWKKLNEEKTREIQERKAKLELVEKQLAKMPEYINQYKAKLSKANEKDRQAQEKRKALLEEARDFFGYDLDPRDPRFEKMALEKEEEEKKLKKKKKREEKLAKLVLLMKS